MIVYLKKDIRPIGPYGTDVFVFGQESSIIRRFMPMGIAMMLWIFCGF